MKKTLYPIAFAATLLIHSVLAAEEIPLGFEQAEYVAGPGDVVTLRVDFGTPVPNGLDVYTLRLPYPSGAFDPAATTISVVPELDNDLFEENPAERSFTADYAEVSGAAPLGDPYFGTTFLEIAVTIDMNTPAGAFPLTLALPGENSFVDGDLNAIDDDLILGSATLVIEVPPPSLSETPEFDSEAGTFTLAFSGVPGRSYLLEVSNDLEDWDELTTLTAAPSGLVTFTDSTASTHPRRFYRLVD
ncbi:MAG: hypothetical protein EA353_07250 [Puniceicoccaceae bacterium]|nr:MAG: hypothetical protein EA353_07250 [Puniceicoccaceae bacterium]